MAGWTSPLNLIREELVQLRDEGCRIPAHLLQRIAELHPERDEWNTRALEPIYQELMRLEPDAALAAREPNDLQGIRALRPKGPRDLKWRPSDSELLDRLHGAWTGRFCGCALGKPVEGMGMRRVNGRLDGRRAIKQYLQERNDWPLKDYFSAREVDPNLKIWPSGSVREKIQYMEPDDDVHYSLVGLGALEQFGPEFTWQNVGEYWIAHIPISCICTAETQAVTNLMNRSTRGRGGNATPAFTRRYWNPYREWIGAQIRADGWAWCCAGKPELAAEFAHRDACWTHERNGIYGEMFMAAIIAAAFVEKDPARLVEIGLSEIPAECRLAQYVRQLQGWIRESPDWEACMDRIEAALPDMHVVHTINNALICIMALHYGKMDVVESPAIAVMGALDTDCNGATVGSITGAACGRARYRDDLAGRLNDTVKPAMIGFQQATMKELAERTAKVWKRVEEYAASRKP